jgi:hypothetical protein
VVEGAVALLHWFRRLRIRWEIRDDVHQAFITLGWVQHTLGLRADGTIVTVGNNADTQCEVDAWSGVQLP